MLLSFNGMFRNFNLFPELSIHFQGKQKKNKGKGKDKGRDDKTSTEKIEEDSPIAEREEIAVDLKIVLEKPEPIEDVSDVSDSVDGVPETPLPDEDRTGSPINWDTDASEMHHPIVASGSGVNGLSSVQNGTEGRIPSAVDDSSSTCSSDSVPSVRSASHKGNSPYHHNQKSPSRYTIFSPLTHR